MAAKASLQPLPTHTYQQLRVRNLARYRLARTAHLPSSASRALLEAASRRDERAAAAEAAGRFREADELDAATNAYVRDTAALLAAAPTLFDADLRAGKAAARAWGAQFQSLGAIEEALAQLGIPIPKAAHIQAVHKRRRYRNTRWWDRGLERSSARRYEDGARAAGLTCRLISPYVSEGSLAAYRARQRRGAEYLADMEDWNLSTGEILPLAQLAAGSLANPANRARELMVKVRGYEDYAAAAGFTWFFAVETCPSAYHRTLYTGAANPRWNPAYGVRAGQRYHTGAWARVRRRSAHEKLDYFGLRTVEPHTDGTAHWNLLIFVRKEHAERLKELIREAWLAESPEEPGAAEHRVRIEDADPKRGSAANYIAKYITKGTSGEYLDGDLATDLPDAEVAYRVRAWARIHGIRQFQFFKCMNAAAWRELRRWVLHFAKNDEPVPDSGVPEVDRLVPTALARPVQFDGFLKAQGYVAGQRDSGAAVPYRETRYALRRAASGRDELLPVRTRWDEDAPPAVQGLAGALSARRVKTHLDVHRIVYGPLELCKAQGWRSQSESGPWTCSTNCPSWTSLQDALRSLANRARAPPDITVDTGIDIDGVQIRMTVPADDPLPMLAPDAPLSDVYQVRLAIAQMRRGLGEITEDELADAEERVELAKKYELNNEALKILGREPHSRDAIERSIETLLNVDPEVGF